MKASNYNYIFYKGQTSYWFNGITKEFFRLSAGLGKKVETTLLSADFASLPEKILIKLKESGFIVSKDTDELSVIRSNYHKAVNNKDYMLVILPTLKCNFNCWYCIQHHKPSMMSEEVKKSIMTHIQYMIGHGINTLHLEWFGGEPILGFKNVILPLSTFAKSLCEEKDIRFFNSATTNGYLLTKDKYETMKAIELNSFQITLDGERDLHNQVKKANGNNSAFDTTLKNIGDYLDYNKKATLKLRINYTHENLTEKIVSQVNEFISEESHKRVQINLKKVWQEKVDKTFYPYTLKIQDKFLENGFNVNQIDMISGFVPCYASRKYYTAINYDGSLLKCTATDDLYLEKPLGVIRADGSLSWEKGVEDSYQAPSFENAACLDCRYLPICMGQCPRNHINHVSGCKMESFDIRIDEGIINYIDKSYAGINR